MKDQRKARYEIKLRTDPERLERVLAQRREYRRVYNLRTLYQMTPDEYGVMHQAQDGRCVICGTDTPGGHGRLYVDHNHVTNRVRGLLCYQCNVGIGHFGDDPSRLRKAAEYLEEG